MKYKTWFRLVLKAIGILLIGLAIPNVLTQLGSYFMYRAQMTLFGPVGPWTDDLVGLLVAILPGIIQTAIGVYLVMGGAWIANLCVPSNRPYCPECGYDLSQSSNVERCSECGTVLPARS